MDEQVQERMIHMKEEQKRIAFHQKQAKQEVDKIKQSNSWKYSKPMRFIMQLKEKLFPKHMNKSFVRQLQKENGALQQLVLEQEELLEKLIITSEQMNTLERQQHLRELKSEGKLIQYLQTYVDEKRLMQYNGKETLIYIARLYMNEEKDIRDYVYEQVRAGLTIDELPEFLLRPGIEEATPLHEVTSFRASLSMRLRHYQYDNSLPEWYLDDKRLAYRFVEQLGLHVPSVDEQVYTVETLPEKYGVVVKPADGAGARGVYIIHDNHDIIDVKQSKQVHHFAELKEAMKTDLQTGAVHSDAWLMEEIVYEDRHNRKSGSDLKFYTFYGKVGLILEITRYPEVRHCWWTRDGKRITAGKYDESLFTGNGVSAEELAMVEELSKEIPAPFIRIDFLRSEEGLVFGEFTPKPGNYDEFNEAIDSTLGDYFIEAESKLFSDLLNEKEFVSFKELQTVTTEV